jgi:hypothetical protein
MRALAMTPRQASKTAMPFEPYCWAPLGPPLSVAWAIDGFSGPAASFPSLSAHLGSQLSPPTMFGPLVLADAREFNLSLHLKGNATWGEAPLTLTGFPDAAFVDSRFAPTDSALIRRANCCVLIKWMTPKAMEEDCRAVFNHMVLLLLAHESWFDRSIPVVATDLCTSIRVCSRQGNSLQEHRGEGNAPLTLGQGIRLICRLGREASGRLALYHERMQRGDGARG